MVEAAILTVIWPEYESMESMRQHAFFLYVENHSLGEWFQRRLVPMMKTEKLLLL